MSIKTILGGLKMNKINMIDTGERVEGCTIYGNGQVAIEVYKEHDKKLYKMFRYDELGNTTFFGGFPTIDKLNFYAGLYGVCFNNPLDFRD